MAQKQPPSSSTVIPEPEGSSFTSYKKDPRLETSILKKNRKKTQSADKDVQRLLQIKDDETFLDELRHFKRNTIKTIIETLESDPLKNRREILGRLSDAAEKIIVAAFERSKLNLESRYGLPTFLSSYKQTQEAHLAVVGMGKLGAKTLNYFSDLDVIFVYSNRGETFGKKVIDNSEYFVKFAQKFISTLSITTSAGRCYEIDTELRPSGHTGTLVTSYDHFIDHQMNKSQNWERQALIRARAMTDEPDYQKLLEDQIYKLIYDRPLPQDFTRDMAQIRERVILERAKESADRIDIKLGRGGLMDIEFIVHNIQIKNGKIYRDLCHRSLFDALDALKDHDFLSRPELETLIRAHLYYRTIESLLHLHKKRSEHILDFQAEAFVEICDRLSESSRPQFKSDILALRNDVHQIYKRVYNCPVC